MTTTEILDGYGRVSRETGRKGTLGYHSPEEQEKTVRQHIERVGARFGVWVFEGDVSGFTAARDRALETLVRRVERRESNGIVVIEWKRLSREHPLDGLETVNRVRKAGGHVIGVLDGFDSASEMSIAYMAGLADHAYRDREVSKARFEASNEHAVERGVKISARANFGYRRIKGMPFEVDRDSAPLVREMFERRAGGESISSLWRWIREEGHPMGRTTVRSLLENEVYLGVVTYGRERKLRNENAHEPLVTRELFDRVQGMRGVRPTRNGTLAGATMLRSLVFCGSCGARMLVTPSRGAADETGARTKYPAYACVARTKRGCKATAYARAAELDAYVDAWMLSVLNADTPVIEAIAASDRVAEARERLHRAEHSLADLRTLDYKAAGISFESYLEMVRAAEARRDIARGEFANAKNAEAGGFEGDLRSVWPTMTNEQKRLVLHGIIERIVIAPSKGRRIPLVKRVQMIDHHGVLLNLTRESLDEAIATVALPNGETFDVEADRRDLLWQSVTPLHKLRASKTRLAAENTHELTTAWANAVQGEHPQLVIRPKR